MAHFEEKKSFEDMSMKLNTDHLIWSRTYKVVDDELPSYFIKNWDGLLFIFYESIQVNLIYILSFFKTIYLFLVDSHVCVVSNIKRIWLEHTI